MGGCAFLHARSSEGAILPTPRVSTEVYRHLLRQYQAILESYFGREAVFPLCEATEKTDHGDIDFVVSSEAFDNSELSFAQLANAVGAAGDIHQSNSICHLAVRLDGTRHSGSAVKYSIATKADTSQLLLESSFVSTQEYVQVDLDLVPKDLLERHLFAASYGGLHVIIGHMTKAVGLSVRNNGLYLRLTEIGEARSVAGLNVAKERGIICISRGPKQVREFLGLSKDRSSQGFVMLEDLYECLSNCRMLPLHPFHVSTLTSARERRMATRPIFSGFWHEWLPSHRPELFPSPVTNRNDFWGHEKHEIKRDTSSHLGFNHNISEARLRLSAEVALFFQKANQIQERRRELQCAIDGGRVKHLLTPILQSHNQINAKSINEIKRAFGKFLYVDGKGRLCVCEFAYGVKDPQLHLLLAEDGLSLKDHKQVEQFASQQWSCLQGLETRHKMRSSVNGWSMLERRRLR